MIGDDGAETKKQAAEVTLENKSCLVAQFFKRYPQADPRRVSLITQSLGNGLIVFRIEYKDAKPFNESSVPRGKRNANRKRKQAKAQAKEKVQAGHGEGKRGGVGTGDMPTPQPLDNQRGEGRCIVEVGDKRRARNSQQQKRKGDGSRLR